MVLKIVQFLYATISFLSAYSCDNRMPKQTEDGNPSLIVQQTVWLAHGELMAFTRTAVASITTFSLSQLCLQKSNIKV
jgi:hypothetical protein